MSSIATCIKKHVPKERKAEFTEALKGYQEAQLADKIDPKEARIKAVDDALAEYREEREKIMAQVRAAMPKVMSTAQEIDRDLTDDLIEDMIEENGGKTNVAELGSNPDLERDLEDAGTRNEVGQDGVPARRGEDERADQQGVPGVEGSRSAVPGNQGVSGPETAASGKRGDISPYSENRRPVSEERITGSDNDRRGGDVGQPRPANDTQAAGAVEQTSVRSLDLARKIAAQRAANRTTTVKVGDRANISETLPLLQKKQQDDVAFAEKRFSKPNGRGVLFTNGTGTGKTFSALGIIKRFERQGKKNILVVAPDDLIISSWEKAAGMFDIPVSRLANTKDAGSGIVITTYANFGANEALAKRKWDLVVTDESHQLSMNEAGESTAALDMLRAITLHDRGDYHLARNRHRFLFDRFENAFASLNEARKNKASQQEIDVLENKALIHKTAWEKSLANVRDEVKSTPPENKPRVVFLSATPFAYEKNIDLAEGYLFDYPEDGYIGNSRQGGFEKFMVENFGYRIRYHKLTEPDKNVNRGVMQRQFNAKLKKEGVLSSRVLDVDFDYDRKFALVESAIGQKIDDGMEFLWNSKKYRVLHEKMQERFDYLSRRYLLESIKAKEVVPIIKEHLALGRKVVVFHDYIKGGGFNPFDFSGDRSNREKTNISEYGQPENEVEIGQLVRDFEAERPDLANLPLDNLYSPVNTLQAAFPDLLVINGQTVTQNEGRENVKRFNDDETGPAVLLVQSDKDKGWSGHDTTGKHPRVLINLGLPTRPTRAIQQEGRIYRVGQASNAIFRYLNTGTNWERWAFASTIAQRASTAENLAMGEEARALLDSFVQGFEESDTYAPGFEGEGTGGKERDNASNAALTEWDRATTLYYSQLKKTSRTKAEEGKDYFATPEPLGLKMVEWANIRDGESVLEPSAGHGAIARWFPENTANTVVEPSSPLASRLKMVTDGKLVQDQFENFNIVNKFDAIVMNPPFGTGGKTAMDHIEKAARHLRDGGRIVALVPAGPSMDKRIDKFLYGEDEKGKPLNPDMHLVASYRLPRVTFERAGTTVSARILIIDKMTDKDLAQKIQQRSERDYSEIENINEFFERIKESSVPDRVEIPGAVPDQEGETGRPSAIGDEPIIEHTTQKGKVIRGVVRSGISKAEAQQIDPYTFKKDGGWFIREKYLAGDDDAMLSTSSNALTGEAIFSTPAEETKQQAANVTPADLEKIGFRRDITIPRRVINELQKYEAGTIIPWMLRNDLVASNKRGEGVTEGLPATDFAAAERFARIYNKKIIWATVGDSYKINGFMVRNSPALKDYIVIDVRSPLPMHSVFGHELTHHIENTSPELFNDLFTAIEPLIKDVEKYKAIRSIKNFSEREVKVEIVADFLGDNFADPKFWRRVQRETSKSQFRRLVDAVLAWIDNLLKKAATWQTTYQADQFFTDVEKARGILAKYVGQYGEGVDGIEAARSIFSKLEQVAKINFTGMKAQGVLNFLNKQGVKKAEIEATGLDSWLAGMKSTDKVSRDDLMNFVQANMVEVEDVVLGEGGDYLLDSDGNRQDDGAGGFITRPNRTSFKDYTEPNADPGSYREMFVTAPVSARDKAAIEYNKSIAGNHSKPTKIIQDGWQDGHSQYSEIRNPIVRVRYNTETRDGKTYLRIEEMQGPSDANQQKMPAYLRDNIYNIGSKRIIAMAKEMGVDGIVFAQKPGRSAGETQADRYSLEKQVDHIDVTPKKNGEYRVEAYDQYGNAQIDTTVNESRLPEVVGKDLARKIVENKGKPSGKLLSFEEYIGDLGYSVVDIIGTKKEKELDKAYAEVVEQHFQRSKVQRYEGLDLKIGGEGLKRLYDTQLPAMLESYAKSKWQETTVETDVNDLAVGELTNEELLNGGTRNTTLRILPITDKTPGSFPLFSQKSALPTTPQFRSWHGDSKVNVPVFHGSPTFGKGDNFTFDVDRATGNTSSPGRGLGTFVTENRNEALGYAGASGAVQTMAARIENPLELNSWDIPQFKDADEARAFRRRKQLQGYDGIHIKDEGHWVAFHPNQLKSITDNSGAFSRKNDDIRYSVGSPEGVDPASHNPDNLKEETNAEINDMARRIQAQLNKGGVAGRTTPWRLHLHQSADDGRGPRVIKSGGIPKGDQEAAERIAGLFGKKIVWASLGERYGGVNGVMIRDKNGSPYVFIDVRSPRPAHVVLGHELSHFMEQEHPKEYREMFNIVAPLITDTSLYMDGKTVYGDVANAEIRKEMIGDILGNAFNDPSFWLEVSQRSPEKFSKIAAVIREWINAVLDKLQGLHIYETDAVVSNLRTARKELAKLTALSMRSNPKLKINKRGDISFSQDAAPPLDSPQATLDAAKTMAKLEKNRAAGQEKKGSITVAKKAKPDSGFLHRLLSTPEYYFEKFPAAWRVLQAALRRRDLRFQNQQAILGEFAKEMQDLKKTNRSAYDEANEYLVDLDQNGVGFSIKEENDGSWKVMNGFTKKDAGSHATETEAIEAMISTEGEYLKEQGVAPEAIQAIKRAREVTNNGFNVMAADMRRIIQEAKENGLPDPFIGDGKFDETGRYGIYAAGRKQPVALFATEKEAYEGLARAAEMIAYTVIDSKGGEHPFMTELRAKAWARKHGGTVQGKKFFQNLVVRQRTDAELRPLTVKQALAQMGDLRGTYFPRIRESGEYILIARKEGEDPIRKHFDIPANSDATKAGRAWNMATPMGREAKRLADLGYQIEVKRDESPSEDMFAATNLVTSIDAILQQAMKSVNPNDDANIQQAQTINVLLTMQVADLFKARGYLSSRMKRLKGDVVWEGYETDMTKALASYATGVAAGTAKRDTARAMILAFTGKDYTWQDYKKEVENPDFTEWQAIVEERRIDPGKQKNLYGDVRNFIIDVLRNDDRTDRIIGTLRGIASLKFLAFRISSAAVNATNMVQGVPATMAAHLKIPLHKAMGYVTAAAVDYGKYRSGVGILPDADRKIFAEISARGWDEAQFNYEAAKELRGKGGEVWNWIMTKGMFMFGAVEKANRAMSIYAAYKAAYQQAKKSGASTDMDVLLEQAHEVSNRAHGTYGDETLPAWTRGETARFLRLPYTFTKFTHNYLLNMWDIGVNKKEYSAAAHLLLAPGVLAGAGATLLTPLAVAALGLAGAGGDGPEEEFYKWVEDMFGSDRLARHGLAGLAGINIKGSLQVNNPMPTKLSELAGAPGAIFSDVAKGAKHFSMGEIIKGVEAVAPTALGSAFRAVREGSEGVTTGNYGTVFYGNDPLRTDAIDTTLRFLSFNPAETSGIREKQWKERKVAQSYQEEKRQIYSVIKRHVLDGQGITPEDLKTIIKFNERVVGTGRPDIRPITAESVRLMLRMNMRPNALERSREVAE